MMRWASAEGIYTSHTIKIIAEVLYEGRPESKDRVRTELVQVSEFLFHPPHSLDLAPSDFHLFTHLKQFLGGTHVGSDEEDG
jgi:hypothetical protein